MLTPPSYDWSKIVGKDPIRFNCRDEALQVLAEPQLLEDVDFSKPLPSLPASVKTSLTFPVTTTSLQNAQKGFERAFAEERQLQSLLLDEQGKRMDAAATAAAKNAAANAAPATPAAVSAGFAHGFRAGVPVGVPSESSCRSPRARAGTVVFSSGAAPNASSTGVRPRVAARPSQKEVLHVRHTRSFCTSITK